ncbi:MAG: hypothetical protein KIT84_28625 [Labilithrix sp.]|nr:hypothetical protein [Labilithrix sp.]MCW5815025.1 hypothetical protein [Labilithrix sp.]
MGYTRLGLVAAALVLVVACDEKKEATPTATSASAVASVVVPPPPPPETASAAPSAAPSASADGSSQLVSGEPDDRIVTVKDPSKDATVSVKVAPAGSLTLFLPDYPGTVWAFEKADGSVGKPKEEVIPGFAPKTNGHQFKWTGVKAGKSTATFGNKKAGDKTAKPTQTFTLTIDAS